MSAATLSGVELGLLVAGGDVELVQLSDEQWDVLGLVEAEDLDPVTRWSLGPVLRSLAAAGLAVVEQDGRAALLGGAALLRSLTATPRARVAVVEDDGSRVCWTSCAPGVLLRHTHADPGVHTFVLAPRRRELTHLAARLLDSAAGTADGSPGPAIPGWVSTAGEAPPMDRRTVRDLLNRALPEPLE